MATAAWWNSAWRGACGSRPGDAETSNHGEAADWAPELPSPAPAVGTLRAGWVDCAAMDAAMLDWLEEVLPKPPARLLTIGWEGSDRAQLERRSYAVSPVARDTAPAGDATADAIAAHFAGAAAVSEAWLDWAHERLPDGHRLVLVVGPSADLGRETTDLLVRLAERSFVVLRCEGPLPGASAAAGTRIVARRDPYSVRGYRPGDEAAILDLFARLFGVQRSSAHFRWKYLDDPYGSLHLSLAFAPEGRLVAHYAGYPVLFHDACDDRPRTLLAHQVGDTMTEPSARAVGRGSTSLIGRAAHHFYAAYCEGRVAFNYGFNRGNIQAFSVRFVGAQRIEDMGYWVRDSSVLLAASWWRAYRVECAEEITAEWDELFERCAAAYRFLLRRDARYVRWRYLECPDGGFDIYAVRRFGRLIGWGVFRSTPEALLWGDSLFEPAQAGAAHALLAFAMRQGAGHRLVRAWFSPRPDWWCRQLGELGFVERPEPQDLALMAVPFTETDVALRMVRGLYYTRGDSDLF